MRRLQILLSLWLIVTFGALAWWDGGDMFRRRDNETMLREIFHVPADIALADVTRPTRGSACGAPTVTARAKLASEQAQRYLAAFDDPKVWRPIALVHYNTSLAAYDYAPDAFRAGYVASARAEAASNGMDAYFLRTLDVAELQRGRFICFAIRVKGEDLFDRPMGEGYAPIEVSACNAPWQGAPPEAYGLAAIDPREGQVRLHLQLSRKAQYCTAAHRRPLIDQLRSK